VVDENTRSVTKIQYQQVRQVKGNNLSTDAAIAIAIGVAAVLGIIIALTWK
jgi:hypothetical protein